MKSSTLQRELSHELAGLPALSSEKLKHRWVTLYGTEPPSRISEDLLRRAVAYRIQERALGGLKASTRRMLERVAEGSLRSTSATPACKLRPGAPF